MSSLPRMSKLPFELLLALRYLRPKRSFVSIITLISIMGVMLGVAVLIIVISVMSGFDAELREKVFGFTAHLRVVKYEFGNDGVRRDCTMPDYASVIRIVASNKNVTGVSPNVINQVLLETQPTNGQALLRAPMVRGIDPVAESSVSQLASNIVSGKLDLSGRGLLIGEKMAYAMELHIGDRVSILSERHLRKMRASVGKEGEKQIPPDEFEVRGVFDAGLDEFNSQYVIMSLERAQTMFGLEDSDEIHGLTVAIRDPYQAGRVAGELERALGGDFAVTTWLQDSPMMQAVVVEKNMMLYILFFIFIHFLQCKSGVQIFHCLLVGVIPFHLIDCT